jgi:hypothetical protein
VNAQAFRNHPSAFDGWIEVVGMVLEVKRLRTRSGRPFTGLVVDQAGERFTVYGPADLGVDIQTGHLIEVEGQLRPAGSVTEVAVHRWQSLETSSVESAVSLLPASVCPETALPALSALGKLERRLPSPLRGFLSRVLLDPRISRPFLRSRASVRHHHSVEGGLLMHSTELLPVIPALSAALLPDEPEAWAYASLGYLLHDVGKVLTVGSEAFPAQLRNLRHESEGLWLLAPHLGWLETQDYSAAAVLRYIFDFVATPAAERKQAKYLVADMVVMLDRLSAGADRTRGLGDLLPMEVIGMAANDPCYREGALT